MPVQQFEVGEWYANRRLCFVVRDVDATHILVDVRGGGIELWPKEAQAEVSEHIQPVLAPGEHWWEVKDGTKYSQLIVDRLAAEGSRALYHFTAIANLSGIRDVNALYSKARLEQAGRWPPPIAGGNELSHALDRLRGNWGFVSLSFSRDTPLAYLRSNEHRLALLVIDLEVAGRPGVRFTGTNAAAYGSSRTDGVEGLDIVDFDILREKPSPGDPIWRRYVQAEVLVPEQIPLERVTRILFRNPIDMALAEAFWGQEDHPPFGSGA